MKKVISLLLLTAMLAMLIAGCSGGTSTEGTNSPVATVSASPAAETEKTDASAGTEAGTVDLPIVPDGQEVTYTVWMPIAPFITSVIKDLNEVTVVKEMSEKTNINFEWTLISALTEEEQYNLMVASGEWCDIIGVMNRYTTGMEGAINDGVIIDIYDKAKELAPNYWNAISADQATFKSLVTESGKMGAFAQLLKEAGSENQGWVIRQDWLDKLGLEKPTTITQLHDTLLAFKDKYNAYAYMPATGINGTLLGAFNLSAGAAAGSSGGSNASVPGGGLFMLRDNEYVCIYDQPEFKEYLSMMAQWYKEGIIKDDFYNDTDVTAIRQDFANDLCGYVETSAANMNQIYDNNPTNTSMLISGVGQITDDAGTPVKVGSSTGLVKNAAIWGISTKCENIDNIFKFVNYIFSDEGTFLYNWGNENEAYTLDENGDPQWTELVINNPDGMAFIASSYLYATSVGSAFIPGIFDMEKTFYNFDDYQWEALDLFKTTPTEGWFIPNWVSMTLEEQEEYYPLQTELETYTESAILAFITGETPIDEYDNFVSTVKSMNYQEMYEIQYAAYQRAIAAE